MTKNVIENAILSSLKDSQEVDSLELCTQLHSSHPDLIKNHQDLHSVLLSLVSLDLIALENKSRQDFDLSAEGKLYAAEGTPEFKYGEICSENPGKNVKELSAIVGEQLASRYTQPLPANASQLANAAFGKAKQLKYVNVKGGAVEAGDLSHDKVKDLLNDFVADHSKVPAKELNDLKKRGLITLSTIKWFGIKKAASYVENISMLRKRVAELTEDMVKSGEWKDVDFAPLNFNALGSKISSGHEHPLLKVRYEFRQIFLQMGFEEMDTTKWVESSFWNFDSLFQGQQHPCRDIQDTFFLKNPQYGNPVEDTEYFKRVKETHEIGGQGSIGLRYNFDDQIPLTNILRTHTTAVSSRYLKMIADHYKKTGEIRPRKFFSIDRVYRNETLDATHLAEFHQVEGFVLAKNQSLADLMSYIYAFFSRIGLKEIEFKPAYNPYTEPSMEIFAKHEGLGRWIEVGNSGIFRPEMLNPMGIPEGWNVVAWGFSLERPTMIEYKIDEIRKLEGPNVSLDLIENVPISRLTF